VLAISVIVEGTHVKIANVNTPSPAPIPVPWQRRWQIVRARLFPGLLLGATLVGTAVLWKQHAASPTFVGQAEPIVANVSSYKPGIVAELKVSRFQRVSAGDILGQVSIAEPRVLASSLAVIQSEIEVLRAGMAPVVSQQRTAMGYDQLRLEWMKERAQLAEARVNLQLAEAEFHRMDELFRDKIVSERVYEQARAARDRLQNEVNEVDELVSEGEKNFQLLQATNTVEVAKVSMDPLRAAIAFQESKLRLTEAELAPLTFRAPIDGIVTVLNHRSGEAVTAGQPILAIATLDAVRIVGYLRPPIVIDPAVGMDVEVRTRGARREAGKARVIEVGTQFDTVPATLLGPVKFASIDMGLPVNISMPAGLKIRPGELVDVRLVPKRSDQALSLQPTGAAVPALMHR
jgi:multidrug resistance efflux pump